MLTLVCPPTDGCCAISYKILAVLHSFPSLSSSTLCLLFPTLCTPTICQKCNPQLSLLHPDMSPYSRPSPGSPHDSSIYNVLHHPIFESLMCCLLDLLFCQNHLTYSLSCVVSILWTNRTFSDWFYIFKDF